jgi:hypothetical protein
MFGKILDRLVYWIDRRNQGQLEMLHTVRLIRLNLLIAGKLYANNPVVISELIELETQAIAASDRNDLVALQSLLSRVEEFRP